MNNMLRYNKIQHAKKQSLLIYNIYYMAITYINTSCDYFPMVFL